MNKYYERTLILVKPDGVARGLIGDILGRFERAGLAVLGLKMTKPTLDFARGHYPLTNDQLAQMGKKTLATLDSLGLDVEAELGTTNPVDIGNIIHERNAEFLSSGPLVACVLGGLHAVKKVRSICGSTMPLDALPGTVRGDYSSQSAAAAGYDNIAVPNLMHASDNEKDSSEPEREIAYWFSKEELND